MKMRSKKTQYEVVIKNLSQWQPLYAPVREIEIKDYYQKAIGSLIENGGRRLCLSNDFAVWQIFFEWTFLDFGQMKISISQWSHL